MTFKGGDKMLRFFLFAMCLLFIATGPVFAQNNPRVEFEGRYWITDLTAKARVTENNLGTNIDFKTDLGLQDENFPEGRFTWHTGPNSELRLGYTQISYRGDRNIQRTIEFDGETYAAGTRVITDLDVRYLSLGWAWQFINIAKGKVRFGTLLEVMGFWVDASLEAPNLAPPVRESADFTIGLPVIGVALDINPHRAVNIFAEISGLPAGRLGYFFDAEAGIKIIPIKNLSIVGGYRILGIKAEDEPDFARLRISGPFVGATLRF